MTLAVKTVRLLAVVVVIAAVAATAASIMVIKQSNRIDSIERRVSAGSVDQIAFQADRDSHNRHFALVSEDKSKHLEGVVTPKAMGFLLSGDIKNLDDGHIYQLWAETPTGPVSVGVLGNDATRPFGFRLPEGTSRLYVTSEVASGAVVPSSSGLVSGALGA